MRLSDVSFLLLFLITSLTRNTNIFSKTKCHLLGFIIGATAGEIDKTHRAYLQNINIYAGSEPEAAAASVGNTFLFIADLLVKVV